MSRQSLRVLVLADSRAFHTERYVRELRRQGCRVLAASLEHGSMIHFHLPERGPLRLLRYPSASCEVRALVRRFRPDVVNAHFVSGYGFLAVLARVWKWAPVIVTAWGSDILVVPHRSVLHRWKVARALRYADVVLGDSEFLLGRARAIAPLAESAVIPWGIEEEYLALYRDHAIEHPLRIIVPRTHEELYGNEFVLEALAPMLNDGRIRLTVPAFGTQVERFRSLAIGLVRNGVKYYKRLSRDCFLKLMAAHDVYLSNARSDSSPASLIEAFALGLIPVAADIPGVREWLTDESGYLYPPGDRAALQAIVERLLKQENVFAATRAQNLAKVRREAIFERNIAATIEIMRGLASKRRR